MAKEQTLGTLIERVVAWPEEAQEVRSIVEIERKHLGVCRLTPEERAAVEEVSRRPSAASSPPGSAWRISGGAMVHEGSSEGPDGGP